MSRKRDSRARTPGRDRDLADARRGRASLTRRRENAWPEGSRRARCLGCEHVMYTPQRDVRLCVACRAAG